MNTLTVLLFGFMLGNSPILNEVRVSFYEASIDLDKREAFYNLTQKKKDESSVAQCYFGAAQTMMAEVTLNPYTKLSYFNNGKAAIEEAIKTNPSNPELRYVRYMIQSNAPDFLGYNNNIIEDLQIVHKAIAGIDDKKPWMLHFEHYRRAKQTSMNTE
ncbi:MAG: hypothetical protein Salg2KO_02890 [Salibacteraceae bacterium]